MGAESAGQKKKKKTASNEKLKKLLMMKAKGLDHCLEEVIRCVVGALKVFNILYTMDIQHCFRLATVVGDFGCY